MLYVNYIAVKKKRETTALASATQLGGALSGQQRVAGLIPGQSTYPGCEFDPWSVHIWEATDSCCSLSLPLSLKRRCKNILE